MSNELNIKLLEKASNTFLKETIKNAEDCLKSYHDTESIVTNKSVSLLQITFPILIALLGYIISDYGSKNVLGHASFTALLECMVIAVSIAFLFEVLFIKKVALLGAEPFHIIQDDIVTNDVKDEELRYLRTRVYSLQEAINCCKVSQSTRKVKYKRSINMLVVGTLIVSLISFLFLLC